MKHHYGTVVNKRPWFIANSKFKSSQILLFKSSPTAAGSGFPPNNNSSCQIYSLQTQQKDLQTAPDDSNKTSARVIPGQSVFTIQFILGPASVGCQVTTSVSTVDVVNSTRLVETESSHHPGIFRAYTCPKDFK